MALSNRNSWSLSGDYQPPPGSLQGSGERLSSATQDWRTNLKFGVTPNATDEYTVNYTRQSGEKGAPLNVYNNPPVPPNSYWRWPWWDIQNTSLLTTTQLGASSYVKGRAYFNTFENGLDAFDDVTCSTQSAPGRFHSPYDDHAYGGSVEFGTTPVTVNTVERCEPRASVSVRPNGSLRAPGRRTTYTLARSFEVSAGMKNLLETPVQRNVRGSHRREPALIRPSASAAGRL